MSSIIGLEVHALNHNKERRDTIAKSVLDFFVDSVGVKIKIPYTNETAWIIEAHVFMKTRIAVDVQLTGRYKRVMIIKER